MQNRVPRNCGSHPEERKFQTAIPALIGTLIRP